METKWSPSNIIAEQPLLLGLTDCQPQPLNSQRVFRPYIEVTFIRPNRISRNRHALDHAMRIIFHHTAIHERTGIAFVTIADHMFVFTASFGNGIPLETGWIASAATPTTASSATARRSAVRLRKRR